MSNKLAMNKISITIKEGINSIYTLLLNTLGITIAPTQEHTAFCCLCYPRGHAYINRNSQSSSFIKKQVINIVSATLAQEHLKQFKKKDF